MLQLGFWAGGYTGGAVQGQSGPCHWNSTQQNTARKPFPCFLSWHSGKEYRTELSQPWRSSQVCGGHVEGEAPRVLATQPCVSALAVAPQLWDSCLWCSLDVNSTRILHFKVLVNLLNPARSNHATSYPLDNEQRLFSFLVPQWNSSFLPARDWGCD